jgi:chromosome segregation ATPase
MQIVQRNEIATPAENQIQLWNTKHEERSRELELYRIQVSQENENTMQKYEHQIQLLSSEKKRLGQQLELFQKQNGKGNSSLESAKHQIHQLSSENERLDEELLFLQARAELRGDDARRGRGDDLFTTSSDATMEEDDPLDAAPLGIPMDKEDSDRVKG